MEAAGVALGHEWQNRKALIDGISTPEIESASKPHSVRSVGRQSLWRGGGGCIVLLMPPDRATRCARPWERPATSSYAQPVAHGLTVERSDDAQKSGRASRCEARRLSNSFSCSAAAAHTARTSSRRPSSAERAAERIARDVVRSFVAPMHASDGTVRWTEARTLDPENLDIRAVTRSESSTRRPLKPEMLMEGALQSEDAFRSYVAGSAN